MRSAIWFPYRAGSPGGDLQFFIREESWPLDEIDAYMLRGFHAWMLTKMGGMGNARDMRRHARERAQQITAWEALVEEHRLDERDERSHFIF